MQKWGNAPKKQLVRKKRCRYAQVGILTAFLIRVYTPCCAPSPVVHCFSRCFYGEVYGRKLHLPAMPYNLPQKPGSFRGDTPGFIYRLVVANQENPFGRDPDTFDIQMVIDADDHDLAVERVALRGIKQDEIAVG